MPLYDFQCLDETCGRVFERLLRLCEYDDPQACPSCGGTSHKVLLPSGVNASHFDPVVIHRNAKGEYRYPGSADAPVPAGFEKVELRTFAEIDQFSRTVNQQERRKIDEQVSREQYAIDQVESRLRPELRAAMQRMTPAQRAFAQIAIARNNANRPQTRDANFFLEAREYDGSNRDAYRDVRSGWKARK